MSRVVSLLPELMIQVIETSIKSQIGGYWGIGTSNVLVDVADQFFMWPEDLADSTRNILKLEVENALFKKSIVKIAMDFTAQDTIMVPPLLIGRQNDLRRLALDLHTTPIDGGYCRALNKGIKSMPSLGADFPNVEVFVLSFYFHCRTGSYTPLRFDQEVLMMRNLKRTEAESSWEIINMKEAIIAFVGVFAQTAPRARKLLRFGTVMEESHAYDRYFVGRLVKVSSPAVQAFGQALVSKEEDESAREEDPLLAYAKRIFDQAYYAQRIERPRQARGTRRSTEDSLRSKRANAE